MKISETRRGPMGVIVGIDIGMTCTGVAICENPDAVNARPAVIQHWPGTDAYANKVPTRVAYKAGEIGIHSWGFECPELEHIGRGMAIKDMFKFYLDSLFVRDKFRLRPEDAPKLENVKLWYRNFLTALYTHIIHILQEKRIDLDPVSTEFIFSIPTSWRDNDDLVRVFRELVDIAGFGAVGHVIMELTEGEASAVFTAKLLGHRFQEGEAFMVCNLGGGTTDICVLQVKGVQGEMVELENLDDPKALAIGSVSIDEMFEARAEEQLRALNGVNPDLVEFLAHQMTRNDFQTLKTLFGTEDIGLLRVSRLPVPNSPHRIDLCRDELKDMFDEQIQKITRFIDNEIELLRWRKHDVRLSYMFLAGGLGSSKYVQDEIVKHYKYLQVMFAPKSEDLPLAVCKGLVIDRLQYLSSRFPVIPILSSKASYGILCKSVYNSKRHSGQQYLKSRLDGKRYAEKQIDWLVLKDQNRRRGEIVTRMYSLLVDPTKPNESWGFSVVRSTLEVEDLPTFLDGKGDVKVICHVLSIPEACLTLHDRDPIQKRRLIGKKSVFSRVDCELSASIGVGKMEFAMKVIGDGDGTPQQLRMQWEDNARMIGGEISGLIRNL